MTLAEFKALHKITRLEFYPSKTSNRRVAGLPTIGEGVTLNTTEDFDPTLPAFVYDNPVAERGYILSNKEPKAAEFVL